MNTVVDVSGFKNYQLLTALVNTKPLFKVYLFIIYLFHDRIGWSRSCHILVLHVQLELQQQRMEMHLDSTCETVYL